MKWVRWVLTVSFGVFALCAATLANAQGTLRVGVTFTPNTFDPHRARLSEEQAMNFLLFSGLTEIDLDGKVAPDLAENWNSSSDLKTWTFNLRKKAKFTDGRTVTSEDVKATINRLLEPTTGSPARGNLAIIDTMETPDPSTILFKLKIPYAEFPGMLADRTVKIIPRDKVDQQAKEPVGSGPFKLAFFQPKDRTELVKNPDYYRSPAKLDRVVLRAIPELAARISALKAGELDLIWEIPPESIDQLKQDSNIVVDSVQGGQWAVIVTNPVQKPFDNVKVRQAIAKLIDKNVMVQLASFGYGKPTHTAIPPGHPAYNDSIPIAKADIEGAKKLLAEAGYPNGFELTLYIPTPRPVLERIGVAARELLKPAGINLDVQRTPMDKMMQEIEGKAALFVTQIFSRPTLDTSIYPFFHSKGTYNAGLWNVNDPDIDKLIDSARATPSDAERNEIYKRFQARALEVPSGITLYLQNHTNAYRKNVKNFRSSQMLWLDLRNVSVE